MRRDISKSMEGIGPTADNCKRALMARPTIQGNVSAIWSSKVDEHKAKRILGSSRGGAVMQIVCARIDAVKQGKDLTEVEFYLCLYAATSRSQTNRTLRFAAQTG